MASRLRPGPKLGAEAPRSHDLRVPMSPAERAMLFTMASRIGVSAAAVVRYVVRQANANLTADIAEQNGDDERIAALLQHWREQVNS